MTVHVDVLIANIRHYGLDKVCETLSLDQKRHPDYPNLILLNYSKIGSPKQVEYGYAARGIILDEADDWKVICHSFDRFFNYGEYYADKEFDWANYRVYEKHDGSLMRLYWYGGKWHVATSGTPDAQCPINSALVFHCKDEPQSFAETFWRIFLKTESDTRLLDTDICYTFEMMTPLNQIVVRHSDYKITLIGARNRETMEEYVPDEIAVQYKLPYKRPITHFQGEYLVGRRRTEDYIVGFVNSRSAFESEGVVLVDHKFRRQKLKSDEYVAVHHTCTEMSVKDLIKIVQANEDSEFVTYFPEAKKVFDRIVRAKKLILYHMRTAIDSCKDISSDPTDQEARKEFGKRIKDEKPINALLFPVKFDGKTCDQVLAQLRYKKFRELIEKYLGEEEENA